jgi:hypothetical protein
MESFLACSSMGHVTKMFAACLAYVYIPRAVRVIFISKPGRDSYKLAKSFRPIPGLWPDIFLFENDGQAGGF